ncbi:MAG: hypothetical protein ACREMS_06620 [Gemmatimonadaceae bacterium]
MSTFPACQSRKSIFFREKLGSHQMAQDERLTSETLALLIIDALVHAKIIKSEDLKRAIEIATEEINVRKAAGDY